MINFILALLIWIVFTLNNVPHFITFVVLAIWTYSSLTLGWLALFWIFLIYTYIMTKGGKL